MDKALNRRRGNTGSLPLCGNPAGKKTREGRKEERHPKQWQTHYLPRPPTSSDQNQTLHGGGLRCVVIHVKCDPNRLSGYGAAGVENGQFLLLWPVANTTTCTTVQAATSTQSVTQSNNFVRLVYRSQIWQCVSICSSKHVVSRTDVPFGGYNI